MQVLHRKGQEIDINDTLNSIPLDKLEDVQKLIAKEIGKGNDQKADLDEGKS
jgi:adenylate kinase